MASRSTRWTLGLPALILALAAGCVPGVQVARQDARHPGQLMFNAYGEPRVGCYRCHNGDATGTKWGPNLIAEMPKLSDAEFQEVVANGRPGMPSHKATLTPEHVASVIAWLRELAGPAPEVR